MKEWGLQSRLWLLVAAVAGLLGLAGALALRELSATVASIDTLYRDRLVPLQQLRSVELAYGRGVVDGVARWQRGALDSAGALRQLDEARARASREWIAYKATELVPRERALIADAERAMAALDGAVAQARNAIDRGDEAEVGRIAGGPLESALMGLLRVVDPLVDVQLDVARQQSELAPQQLRRSLWIGGVLMALAVAAGSALSAWVLARYRRERAAADSRIGRMAEFYRALSRTNQLIVRGTTEAHLFEELCRICVDNGHALVARVDRLEGRQVRRVAVQSPSDSFFAGLAGVWDLDDPVASQSMLGSALRSGVPVIFNDYQNDPRTTPFQARARAAGIRSGAAFALHRGGHVCASLALYATETGFFDVPLIELITEMSSDVSFALDRIDRDEEIRTFNQRLEQSVQERTVQLRSVVGELERARDVAESASRAKAEFLANMSHEIRTPINAVLGLTDLVLRTPLEARQRDYIGKTRLAADALLQLVDSILDFSKIEARRLELEAVPFALQELTDQVSAIVAARAEGKGVVWRVVRAGRVPEHLVGDVQRLRQVLVNLCGNAVKFTAAGEVTLEVRGVEGAPPGRCRLHFEVRDTGIGIEPTQLERLFQPFAQGDASTSRHFGGTGLGLAISKQLVELMGGVLDVRSTPGAGSEFGFTVELALDHALAAAPAVAEPHVASLFDALRGRRVLLVEDNELNQLVVADLLRDVAEMDVEVACNGDEALAALARRRFDALLCDVHLPGMDGYELTRRIRRQPATQALPIVAVTAHASVRDRDLCRAAGMDEYLTKPFDPQQLFRVLSDMLQARARTAEAEPPPVASRSGVLFALGLERCLGRRELYEKIVRRYLDDRGDLAQRLRTALAEGHEETAVLLVHNLVSTAGTIGALALSDIARELQLALVAGERGRCLGLIDALAREHRAVELALASYLRGSATL